MTAPALPETGTSWPELQTRMAALAGSDVDWRRGKTAVYVFNAGEDVERVQKAAYGMFMAENGLGPSAFPSLKRMEEEVVGYGLALLHVRRDAQVDGALDVRHAFSVSSAERAAASSTATSSAVLWGASRSVMRVPDPA